MRAYLATVSKVLPERHGVLVRFNDGAHAIDTGGATAAFVRVLARRSHPQGGSEVCYPQVGELGVVIELQNLYQIWIGSLHWQDNNQVDPLEGLYLAKHDSGIQLQERPSGDMQFDHPSGLRITVAQQAGPLSTLQRNGQAGPEAEKTPCYVEVEHPKGLKLSVDTDGAFTLVDASGGQLAIDKDGNMVIQEGTEPFVMKPFYDWAKNHTHSGVQTGSGASGPPASPPPSTSISPDSLKGPHA